MIGPADEDDVALLGDEVAVGEVGDEGLIDRRAGEVEHIEVLGKRELGDGELVLDRACLLLGYLALRRSPTKRCGSCLRLSATASVSS